MQKCLIENTYLTFVWVFDLQRGAIEITADYADYYVGIASDSREMIDICSVKYIYMYTYCVYKLFRVLNNGAANNMIS